MPANTYESSIAFVGKHCRHSDEIMNFFVRRISLGYPYIYAIMLFNLIG